MTWVGGTPLPLSRLAVPRKLALCKLIFHMLRGSVRKSPLVPPSCPSCPSPIFHFHPIHTCSALWSRHVCICLRSLDFIMRFMLRIRIRMRMRIRVPRESEKKRTNIEMHKWKRVAKIIANAGRFQQGTPSIDYLFISGWMKMWLIALILWLYYGYFKNTKIFAENVYYFILFNLFNLCTTFYCCIMGTLQIKSIFS